MTPEECAGMEGLITGFREIPVLNKRHALGRRTIQKGVLRESLMVLEKA
ncbi:MAG: hypothetical protein HY518_03180 [Candidatus Aenigmarchaeota archaeon]|nr:hypothetical protein [Candidatus Aenigmarchaeota archaeon]